MGYRFLLNPVWSDAKAPTAHGYTFREPSPTVKPEFRRLFPHIPKELCVALIAVEKQAKKKRRQVLVGGGRTTPVTLVVTPGTELSFRNTDPFSHRLYGVGIKTFNPATTKRGAERVWAVPQKGVYEIRDELVPSLRMWVVAEPKVAAIAYPTIAGAFSFTELSQGEYTLQTYFAGKPLGNARPITITGPNLALDISRTPVRVATKPKAGK